MSYIIEQAGGAAIDGRSRILDIQPNEIHQRIPFFAGSRDDVYDLSSSLALSYAPST